VPIERELRWEPQTFDEVAVQLKDKGWLFGHFPDCERVVVCTRVPCDFEMEMFRKEQI
jgi:hypothetical protein